MNFCRQLQHSDGFDFGVGTLYPFLGKSDEDKRKMINSLGPLWDGNEVWLVTGGGALFAAFPHVYATVFSGFYTAFMLLLFMLIFPMRARTFAWIMFAVTFVFTLGHSAGGVSHVAHLGGMVVGYLYLKRAWRLREFLDELRWKLRRRKFKVMPPKDDDWIH